MNEHIQLNSPKPEFIVVGDIHLCNTAPSCRIDNYAETCIKKLEFILDYCIDNEIDLIVIEGDVFHKHQIPIQFLSTIIATINAKKEIFKLRTNRELVISSIIGNHDLPFENHKYIDRSPIYLMFETNTLRHFKHITLRSNDDIIEISGFDYAMPLEKSTKRNECCVAHTFFGFDFLNASLNTTENHTDRISEEQAKDLGYKVYFLGHDHTYYGVTNKFDYKVVRPGSLLRNSSHTQQTNRIPCFYHVKKSNDDFEFKQVEVSVALSSNAVFTVESLLKPKKQELEESVKAKISDVIFSLSEEEKEGDSVETILKNIIEEKHINSEVQNVLLKYFSRENAI